jgi:hypothetical protein
LDIFGYGHHSSRAIIFQTHNAFATILAFIAGSANTGAVIEGRLLIHIAAVTLQGSAGTKP